MWNITFIAVVVTGSVGPDLYVALSAPYESIVNLGLLLGWSLCMRDVGGGPLVRRLEFGYIFPEPLEVFVQLCNFFLEALEICVAIAVTPVAAVLEFLDAANILTRHL